jgi:tRNA pseudouridine38-40 synthase
MEKTILLRNLLFVLSYDGKNFHGWQIQKNAVTVQEIFQTALQRIVGQIVRIKGCSRTDVGVHANMYCVSAKIKSYFPCERLLFALNKYLPSDISVTNCLEVPLDFHARYSCKAKEYVYKIWNYKIRNPFLTKYALHYWHPLDVPLLNEAARIFIGEHDFSAFCTKDSRKIGSMRRIIKNFYIEKNGEMLEIFITADGFLYNMVRIIVGTLLKISQKKIDIKNIHKIIESKNRYFAGPTAPSYGLYLNKLFYEGIIL